MPLRLLLPAFLALLTPLLRAEEIRRVALDGTTPVAAPAQEDGKDGIARVSKVEQPSLELFPTAQQPAHGTIVIAPGGGYSILAIGHEGRAIAKMLNDAGWDAAVLLYRVSEGPQTRELAIADAQKALQLVQKKGTDLGLHPQKIGLLGFSAGGHLVARLDHASAESNPPNFLVLIYPAYLAKDGKVVDEVAPTKTPTFIYVAADDGFSADAKVYEAAAKEKGLRCELHLAPSGGHGFGLKEPLPAGVRDWPDLLRKFLDSVQ